MILQCLRFAIVWLLKLIIPPPSKAAIPRIDPNATCPGCGNCDGWIQIKKLPTNDFVIEHNCKECRTQWHEKPIMVARDIIHLPTDGTKFLSVK